MDTCSLMDTCGPIGYVWSKGQLQTHGHMQSHKVIKVKWTHAVPWTHALLKGIGKFTNETRTGRFYCLYTVSVTMFLARPGDWSVLGSAAHIHFDNLTIFFYFTNCVHISRCKLYLTQLPFIINSIY